MEVLLFILLRATGTTNPITDDGGISAGWVLVVLVGLVGILGGYILTGLKNDVKDMKEDLHFFIQQQTALNAKFEERTKDL